MLTAKAVWLSGLVVLSAFALGCSERKAERARCQAAVETARDAIVSGDPEAESLIAAADEQCPEKESYLVDRLRQTYDTRQKTRAEPTASAANKSTDDPLSAFVGWVATLREASDKGQQHKECFPRGHDQFGWCTGAKEANEAPTGHRFVVRYWKDDPRAFMFWTVIDEPAVCADLGEHGEVRRWKVDGVEKVHCDVRGGALRGLTALIMTPSPEPKGASRVELFSREFVRRERGFEQMLLSEGR